MVDEDIELAAKVHYSFLPDCYDNEFIEIAVKAIPFAGKHSSLGSADFNAALCGEIFGGDGRVTDDVLVMTITVK